MILVSSHNGGPGMDAGWSVLSSGGTALDAVEAACRLVEDEPSDHTVGYGGYPNVVGEVELDASIMDGSTRRAGAVGALRGYRYAITVARAVMDRLPHVLITGDGAARIAEELGMQREDLLTPEARRVWQAGVDRHGGQITGRSMSELSKLAADPEQAAGTVNFIAIDSAGHIASGVSTSGWAWKFPGRLGDTPVIGAGNYADDRWGAAACTGWGEMSVRAATAHSVVSALRAGVPLRTACEDAVRDLAGLHDPVSEVLMHVVAVDSHGNHCAASTRAGRTYLVRGEDGGTLSLPRMHVDLAAGDGA
ncbi:MAG TPA: N(4)-(beta-N-acetylglucosaminyl)-L-asparaginase [Actinomycetota bacterium]|nr:N(4)-(beta-N-acetylglucosaminyl)-L-asparaginase [Actinomycetota bacterium]